MPDHITGERLTSLFRPRSVALVGASDKSAFSQIAYHNLVRFGFAEHTYLVSRRGTPTHGQPTVTSCAQIGEPVDVAYLMVPQAGLLEALDDTGGPYGGQMFVDAIGAGMRAASCPTAYVNQVMQPVTGYTRAAMERGGVPYIIPGLRQAVVALRNVAWWSEATRTRDEQAPAAPVPASEPARRRGKWSEQDARALLAEAGIPVVPARLAGSADEAVKAAADLGGPLSVKIVSADILHKSDIGGVRLDVPADEDAVRAAYQAVTAAAPDGARIEALDVLVTWREHS